MKEGNGYQELNIHRRVSEQKRTLSWGIFEINWGIFVAEDEITESLRQLIASCSQRNDPPKKCISGPNRAQGGGATQLQGHKATRPQC
jgi:hypothetical protein